MGVVIAMRSYFRPVAEALSESESDDYKKYNTRILIKWGGHGVFSALQVTTWSEWYYR